MKLSIKPENGMKVLVRGRVGLYEPRGEYQFIAEHMEDAGVGQLQKQFEVLKLKLSKAGLFDEKFKQELPEPIIDISETCMADEKQPMGKPGDDATHAVPPMVRPFAAKVTHCISHQLFLPFGHARQGPCACAPFWRPRRGQGNLLENRPG